MPHKLRGEGHFAAVLVKNDGTEGAQRLQKTQALPSQITDFLPLDGACITFGETHFLVPQELPSLDGLRVLRAGLELGELHKGRFLPSHALALWLKDFPLRESFPSDSREIAAYLRGETLHGTQKGWVLLCVDGYSLGWARGADGILKNHYPKGLRRTR